VAHQLLDGFQALGGGLWDFRWDLTERRDLVEGPSVPPPSGRTLSRLAEAQAQLTLDVRVTGGSAERIAWGGWGEAVMLDLAYKHPRTGKPTQIRQAARIARQPPFELKMGARASVVCWGVMPSAMLRHPLFLGWT